MESSFDLARTARKIFCVHDAQCSANAKIVVTLSSACEQIAGWVPKCCKTSGGAKCEDVCEAC